VKTCHRNTGVQLSSPAGFEQRNTVFRQPDYVIWSTNMELLGQNHHTYISRYDDAWHQTRIMPRDLATSGNNPITFEQASTGFLDEEYLTKHGGPLKSVNRHTTHDVRLSRRILRITLVTGHLSESTTQTTTKRAFRWPVTKVIRLVCIMLWLPQ
jgi:hypothetical protein